MKNVLVISQIFPPVNKPGSARPFFFVKHLSEFGYFPTVISATPQAGGPMDESLMAELLGRAEVRKIDEWSVRRRGKWNSSGDGRSGNRVQTGRDSGKRAVRKVAASNRWLERAKCAWSGGCWSLPVLAEGLRALHDPGFDLIWATGDPWNSLMAGYWLSKVTGKPLVADLRDPWTYGVLWSPQGPVDEKWNRDWEGRILRHAKRSIFTSPLTTSIMAGKYPDVANRFETITNGFREESTLMDRPSAADKCVFRFVGGFGKNKRPAPFFDAVRLAMSMEEGFARDARFELIGRIGGYLAELEAADLGETVQWLGYVSHSESLAYMRGADALVLLQTESGEGGDCISGKAFEYLRAGRPILAITPPDSGDAWLILSTGAGTVTGPADPSVIAREMIRMWRRWMDSDLHSPADVAMVDQYSRRNTTARLAAVFDDLSGGC